MQLNIITVKELQYFVGKVCTILTPYQNIKIQDQQFIEFFVGRVESISSDCIWISNLTTGIKSVFFDIISINEERVITSDDPDYPELSNQVKSDEPEKLTLDMLSKQVQQLKLS